MKTLTEKDKKLLDQKAVKDVSMIVKTYHVPVEFVPALITAHKFGAAGILDYLIDSNEQRKKELEDSLSDLEGKW